MASRGSAKWRELPRPNKSECPKLFYSFSTNQYGFTLRLTDLVAIWECSRTRLDIISSARAQRSSIDPSESSQQFHVLLEKLEQSLEAGANHLFRAKDESLEKVYIKSSFNLPRPLKPLLWTFELEPQDTGELAEQLLRPCLLEASVAKQKIESLLRVIKDKDHVLSRLLEKIENSSIDLSLIFPGVTGLKSRKARVTARDAEKNVPGMAEFNYGKWSSAFENDGPYAGFDENGMNSLVTGCERCPKHTIKQHANWLKNLPLQGTTIEELSPETKRSTKRKIQDVSQDDDSTDTDNDFERAPTPPHLKKKPEGSKKSQQPRSSSPDTSQEDNFRPAKKAKLGGVGRLGGNKATEAAQESRSSPEYETPRTRQSDPQQTKGVPEKITVDSDSETETASEAEHNAKPSHIKHQDQQPQMSGKTNGREGMKRPGRLGSHSSHRSSSSRSSEIAADRHSRHSSQASRSKSPAPQRHKIGGLRSNKQSQQRPSSHDSRSDTDSDPNSDLHKSKSPSKQSPQSRRTSNTNTNSDTDSDTGSSKNHKTKTQTTKLTISPRKLGRLPNHNRSSSQGSNEAASKSTPSKKARYSTAPAADGESTATETASDSSQSSPESKRGHTRKSTHGQPQQPKTKSKLHSTSQSAAHSDSTPTPVPDPKPEPEPVKEETAEEKANRRREELKKRLNTTGQGKKKRKF